MRGTQFTIAAWLAATLASSSVLGDAAPASFERLGPVPKDQVQSEEGVRGRTEKASAPYRDAVSFSQGRSRTLQPRIVGGQPAPIAAYPWIVSIGLTGVPTSVGHFCGGALISAEWVVTAAHCVDGGTKANAIQVRYGTNFLSQGGRVSLVERIVVHPKWHRPTFTNDVALLKLPSPAEDAVPVHLLEPDAADRLFPPGVLGVAAGWGLIAESGDTSDVLNHVGLQVVSNAVCNGPQSYASAIGDGMFCAGFVEGGRDSCQGDSGGPFMIFDQRGGYQLAGIVSWGEGCARPQLYGVYTRVANYSPWIADTLNGGTAAQ